MRQAVAEVFSRGSLPLRIRTVRSAHGVAAGSSFSWDEAGHGYRSSDGKWWLLAEAVRRRFGRDFVAEEACVAT